MPVNKQDLKAFVEYNKSGRIIPGSLILRRSKPRVGRWKEIPFYKCCDPNSTTTTTTTIAPIPFISVWRTTSPDESIELPYDIGIYAGTIDWGDGTTSVNSQANKVHTYAVPGDYTVTITGKTWGWSFNVTNSIVGNNAKIISVTQWGNNLRLSNNGRQFASCTNLDLSGVTDIIDLTGVTHLNEMFYGCTSLTTINRVNEWNINGITTMLGMFAGATSFNQDLNGWDVSNVTNMAVMFVGATSFNGNITSWNIISLTSTNSMFYNATSFNQPIGTWNTSSVTDMGGMFTDAASFNQNINAWDVSNVTNMNGMFYDATSFNQDISGWNVSNVANMTDMFGNAAAFNQDLSGWCVLQFSSQPGGFSSGATSWVLPKPVWGTCATSFVSTWRTTAPSESVTLPYRTEGTYKGFINWGDGVITPNTYANRIHTYTVAGDYTVQISGKITHWLGSFGSAAKLRSISRWGIFSIAGNYAQFSGCTNLDLSAVTDVLDLSGNNGLTQMFFNCTSLTTINRVDEWDLSGITITADMFTNATNFNDDISAWDVSNVDNMGQMFKNASSFNQDLSGWCVTLIPSTPTDFATGATAWVLPKPVWGTCPP
jgi:surface protein